MNIIRQYIKVIILVFLAPLMAAAQNFEDNAPPSLADHLHLSHSKDPVDSGWLPNLTGLPDEDQSALLMKRVWYVIVNDKDRRCAAINLNLRMMVFEHFAIHQQMANAQHMYFKEQMAYKWAHILAMLLKESSGDSASITDMRGHSISTYQSKTNLQHGKQILSLKFH